MAISQDKLPKNIEAEKATLGAMLTSRSVKDQALAELNLTDFYSEILQKIFEAIFNLNDKGVKVDIQTVTQELTNLKNKLDKIMTIDRSSEGYLVRSLYFDTVNDDDYYDSYIIQKTVP